MCDQKDDQTIGVHSLALFWKERATVRHAGAYGNARFFAQGSVFICNTMLIIL